MTIIFICETCRGINKHNADRFIELPEYTFRTFSGAWEHMFQNPDHYMDTKVDNDPE